MSFMKPLAKTGLFGLGGLAASGAFDKNKKPKPSLVTGNYPAPSLVNSSPTLR